MSTDTRPAYGDGDASFLAAGGEQGIRRLVEDFYAAMQRRPEAQRILRMHPPDLSIAVDKLARFLCGWLGGPKLFSAKYGSIRIPAAHQHLPLGPDDRDEWLRCMKEAVDLQPYAPEFKRYLLTALRRPADRILAACAEAARTDAPR